LIPFPARVKRPVLRRSRWLFLALAISSLGYVAFSLVAAQAFQAYENWRLNHAQKNVRQSSAVAESKVLLTSLSANSQVGHPTIALGSVLGRIEIGRIGVAVVIVEGASGKTLRRAVGHVPGTALPGERGNVAITGHRDTFFIALRNIREDDEVTLTTLNGSYRYRVDSMRVVEAEDTEVLNDSDESILTMVTCYPFYFIGPAPKRFIVRAHRI
jgi:sortase A